MWRRASFIAVALSALLVPVAAQVNTAADINAKIRQEESSHSQIMRTLHVLTDVYGPRVTGSPNLKAAGEWAIKQMASWGFSNGHLEPWDFGHPGWVNERFSAHIIVAGEGSADGRSRSRGRPAPTARSPRRRIS